MTAAVAGVCAALGLVVGSFLTVVAHRVPKKVSVVTPRSHCDECSTTLAPRDLVPVVSWVLLRGRCRHCRARIGRREPLIEVACAVLFAIMAVRFEGSWVLPAYLVFVAALLVLSVIDLEHYLLPNKVIYPTGFLTAPLLVGGAFLDGEPERIVNAAIGAVGAFAVFYAMHFVYQRGMAFGDVRLSFLVGMHLGWLRPAAVLIGLFLAFVIASVVGVGLILVPGRSLRSRIPFGPFLAAGALIGILFGDAIATVWLGR